MILIDRIVPLGPVLLRRSNLHFDLFVVRVLPTAGNLRADEQSSRPAPPPVAPPLHRPSLPAPHFVARQTAGVAVRHSLTVTWIGGLHPLLAEGAPQFRRQVGLGRALAQRSEAPCGSRHVLAPGPYLCLQRHCVFEFDLSAPWFGC